LAADGTISVGAGGIAVGVVGESNIDFGTAAGQVSAVDIMIEDLGGYYTATEVENALQEVGGSLASLGGFSAGSVLFADATGAPTEDNANLFFDDTGNMLRVNEVEQSASDWGLIAGGGFQLASDNGLSWSSTTAYSGAKDIGLERSLAGVLEVTDGSTGLGGLHASTITAGSGSDMFLNPDVATTGSSVAYTFDTLNTLLGSDKIASFLTNGTEYAYINRAGKISATGGLVVGSNTGLQWGGANTAIVGVASGDIWFNTKTATERLRIGADSQITQTAVLDAATGDETAFTINYTTNKATSGNDYGLRIVNTDTASPGTSYLMRMYSGGTADGNERLSLTNTGRLTVKDSVFAGASVQISATGAFSWKTGATARSVIWSDADGNIRLTDSAFTDFGLLQFGGTTASFPAIKRNSAAIELRLADDSAVADLIAGTAFLPSIKSGATQAGAGAAADELWKTSGHATLPDNVIMIGI
ncbi:MAG: hypothetical protein Q8P33_03015, partial [bacterium]|nr:hypothetical protein [bacterium]